LLGSGRGGHGRALNGPPARSWDHAVRISVYGLGKRWHRLGRLAADGHTVVGVDTNPVKVDLLNQGHAPVVEAGLGEIAHQAAAS
jgi:GDP-mannose 6-dehydrogenase